uniref:Uncharacterized protein n=1 Tax=viral metagenome TaxID=1070528 RepID=A0A6C0AYV8_9ZZZZ|tara:strand:- start:21817 stop:23235 length:1419 start_codon:yes stop_codon:yes gene_type:complete
MSKNILISFTSIPRRLNNGCAIEVLYMLNNLDFKVVLTIPENYTKFGEPYVPQLKSKNITIWRSKIDYGPATKLLGGLEYIMNNKETNKEITHIITLDDDCLFDEIERLINDLYNISLQTNNSAINNYAGIIVNHYPYGHHRVGGGLKYTNGIPNTLIDAPQGFRGVIYPLKKIFIPLLLNCFQKLNKGVYVDDDAYLGICMSLCNIPIISKYITGEKSTKAGTGGSAVEENTTLNRMINEMNIYQHAVKKGYLPSFVKKNNNIACIIEIINNNFDETLIDNINIFFYTTNLCNKIIFYFNDCNDDFYNRLSYKINNIYDKSKIFILNQVGNYNLSFKTLIQYLNSINITDIFKINNKFIDNKLIDNNNLIDNCLKIFDIFNYYRNNKNINNLFINFNSISEKLIEKINYNDLIFQTLKSEKNINIQNKCCLLKIDYFNNLLNSNIEVNNNVNIFYNKYININNLCVCNITN